jgi:hypothetical protein
MLSDQGIRRPRDLRAGGADVTITAVDPESGTATTVDHLDGCFQVIAAA